jgi:hypothetical protein
MTTTREAFKVGETATFTYSFEPDPTSEISARLAHRTGQTVTVLRVETNDAPEGWTFTERMEEGTPWTYGVRFEDGHQDTVFEDELTEAGA